MKRLLLNYRENLKLNLTMEERITMKIVLYKFILLVKIKVKKRVMYSKAKQYGLTNPIVVNCSQELDTLLNKYQEILVYQENYDTSYRSLY